MSVLARSRGAELEALLQNVDPACGMQWLRAPETGLVMVRGRIGGTGGQFNVGEVTVTRCALRLLGEAADITGFAWVMGRDARHAELAARCDALLQTPRFHDTIEQQVIAPIARRQRSERDLASRKAAATTAPFHTLARGED
jgi:alpha-D-ribose 1-methylphosphonate 5-triphosphate synthase subunit PhnG